MTILPRRHIAFVVLSALFLTAAAIGTFVYVTYEPGCDCARRGPEVLVMKATRDISANEVLTQDLVAWEHVPERFLPPNYIDVARGDLVLGSIVKVDVKEHSMILESDLVASLAPPRTVPHVPSQQAPRDLSDDLAIPTPDEIMPETEF